METSELEVIKPEEFGIEEKTATELTTGLKQVIEERELLIEEFETVSKLEISEETIPQFKALRLKIQKNRTQGINQWHKLGKEYFLRGGQFLDAIKRKENAINEHMEEVLMNGEKHFENLEQERLDQLQKDRAEALLPYDADAAMRTLFSLQQDEFDAFLAMKKKQHEERIAAEKKAEEERIAREKKEAEEREAQRLENIRLKEEADKREAAIKAEREKQEKAEKARLEKERIENKKREAELAKERAAAKAKQDAIEAKAKAEREAAAAKQAKLEAELKAKKEAEEKAAADAEAAKQAELNKGDEDKFKDLLNDLEGLKTKYTFKSKKNIKMYQDVGTLLDKVITHISK